MQILIKIIIILIIIEIKDFCYFANLPYFIKFSFLRIHHPLLVVFSPTCLQFQEDSYVFNPLHP
jgi:hypothetical protein